MASILEEQLGVASGAAYWDAGAYRIWQSTVPDILFFAPRELRLATETGGRFRASLNQVQRWRSGSLEVTGGSAVLGVFPDPDGEEIAPLADQWRRVVVNSGYTASPRPRFLPLPVRDVWLTALLDPAQAADTDRSAASLSGRTLMVNLTAAGARDWVKAARGEARIGGSIRASYEYPQLLPRSTAAVTLHGTRAFAQLAAALHTAADGTVYGALDEIRDAWDSLLRLGGVTIVLSGTASPSSGERAALLARFAEQAREQLFDLLFRPYDGKESAPGQAYALRWRRATDAVDFPMSISFEGWTWLKTNVEADLAALLGSLDESYIHTTYESVTVPVSVVVEPSAAAANVAVSLDFGKGRAPEAPVFDAAGGTRQFTVSTERPDTLAVAYRAKVDFTPPAWPVIETSGTAGAADGHRIVLRPQSWIRRHTMYLYVRSGGRILPAPDTNAGDYLALTATYRAPYISRPIRAALRITPQAPIEFSYPVPPGETAGRATVSVMGTIGGQPVNTADIPLQESEDSVFFLVDGTDVRIVSRSVVAPESDALAERLRAANGRPVVTTGTATAEDTRDVDVDTGALLIPQPTDVTCWAASLAMVVSARDQASTDPTTIVARAGMDLNTGYGWDSIRNAVRTWNLVEEGPQSAMPEEWARWLSEWGPIWIVEIGAPYHAVVLSAIQGDGTPEGTNVTVLNPWPPGVGAIDVKSFLEFHNEYDLGAGAGAAIVHAATN